MNLIFYHFNCSERLFKSHHVFLVPVVAVCSQLLLKSVSKLFENVEWSNSLLRHFKIQTLLKINCSMAAISAFGVTQHSQIFSLLFRNRIQCTALYQLHNSQALLNLRLGYYNKLYLVWTSLSFCLYLYLDFMQRMSNSRKKVVVVHTNIKVPSHEFKNALYFQLSG